MAKDSSKGGGGGTVQKTSVVSQDGTTVDLSETPLTYGQKDPNVSV